MPGPYNAAQVDVARRLWNCGKARGWDATTCAAFLGNVDGECSFEIHAWGDHDAATDIEQDHKDRRDMILAHTGINMVTADVEDQFKGIMWEMSSAPSPYRRNEALLIAATDLRDKVAVLVAREEQSGNQPRDEDRRTDLADFWLAYASAHGW